MYNTVYIYVFIGPLYTGVQGKLPLPTVPLSLGSLDFYLCIYILYCEVTILWYPYKQSFEDCCIIVQVHLCATLRHLAACIQGMEELATESWGA